MGDLEQRKFELVGQAIGDIQGSIHANDSKSAAGLVVHGLLATGVLALVGNLGSVYDDAGRGGRALIVALLTLALGFAVASVYCLVRAVRPYIPEDVNERNRERGYRGLFFPNIEAMTETASKEGGEREIDQLHTLWREVEQPEQVELEYLGELAAVADIRAYEANWAKLGFNLLIWEIGAVAAFLVVVGASAVF